MYSHIHLIPRRKVDTPNPRGSVRGVIPNKWHQKLGDFLYTIYPKPDAEFTAAIRRITTHRNKLKNA